MNGFANLFRRPSAEMIPLGTSSENISRSRYNKFGSLMRFTSHSNNFILIYHGLVIVFSTILTIVISVYIGRSLRESYETSSAMSREAYLSEMRKLRNDLAQLNHTTRIQSIQLKLDETERSYTKEIKKMRDDLNQMNQTIINTINGLLDSFRKKIDSDLMQTNRTLKDAKDLLDTKIMNNSLRLDELDFHFSVMKMDFNSEKIELEKILHQKINLTRDFFNESLRNHLNLKNAEINEFFRLKLDSQSHIGDIKYSMEQFDHDGWLLCDGRELSRSNYSTLFNMIGILYGYGDHVTTFNLLDGRGRTPVGAGKGVGLKGRLLGELGGAESVKLTVKNIPKHRHSIDQQNVQIISNGDTILQGSSSTETENRIFGSSSNDQEPIEIVQPYVALNMFIFVG